MTDEQIQAEFAEAIHLLESVGDVGLYAWEAPELEIISNAVAKAHALVVQLAPADKTFLPQLDRMMVDLPRGKARPPECVGLLKAARAYFLGGFDKLRSAASAEAFANLLDVAQHLHRQDLFTAAVAVAGAVLENELGKLHEARIGPWPTDSSPSIGGYNDALYRLNRAGSFPEYDNNQQQRVAAMNSLRNEADHGRVSNSESLHLKDAKGVELPAIDAGAVQAMIEDVRRFIVRFQP